MSDGPIGYDVDISSLTSGITSMLKKIPGASKLSLLDIGYEIIRLSSFEVPHDKGSLQNSATVQEIGGDVVIGYHEPYAARLHEHPEYNFQKGRKGKYLADPINTNAGILGLRLTKKLQQELDL